MIERRVGARKGGAALALVLTLGLAGCGGEPPARGGSAFELELMAADRAFNQATQEEGLEGWVSFFVAQGAMIQPNIGEVRGLDEIRRVMGGLDDPAVTLTWEPIRAQGSADGTLGYTVGRYESTVRLAADTTVSRGLYVTIWRRQPDGSLRVAMDLGNPTEP